MKWSVCKFKYFTQWWLCVCLRFGYDKNAVVEVLFFYKKHSWNYSLILTKKINFIVCDTWFRIELFYIFCYFLIFLFFIILTLKQFFSSLPFNLRKFTKIRILSWIKEKKNMEMPVKFTKSCKLKRERFKMSRFSEFLSTFHHHREISMIMIDEVRNISFLQAINKNISTNNSLSKSLLTVHYYFTLNTFIIKIFFSFLSSLRFLVLCTHSTSFLISSIPLLSKGC